MADPGFPIGGADFVGGANSRGGYVSKNLYVKTKESGPLGGRTPAAPLDPPMTVADEIKCTLMFDMYYMCQMRLVNGLFIDYTTLHLII